MEERDRNKPEESEPEDLHTQDPEICQVQEKDADGLQPDQKSKKIRDEASTLGATHEIPTLQEEKEPSQNDPIQESQQNSETSESSLQECSELAENVVLELKTDTNMMDESTFIVKQGSSQTKPETEATQEGDALEGKLLKSDRNITAQRATETPENILPVPVQNSIPKDAIRQEYNRRVDESFLQKSVANLVDLLKSEGFSAYEYPLRVSEDEVQQESDGTMENNFQENDFGTELGESRHVCLRTQQLEDASHPVPSTCHHIIQHSILPPVQEDQEPPLEPFEVEIAMNRYRRILGERLLTLPPGVHDYVQRVRDRHIPPERRSFSEELPRRCLDLVFGLLIGAILVLSWYFLIDFFGIRYVKTKDTNITSRKIDSGVSLNFLMEVLNEYDY